MASTINIVTIINYVARGVIYVVNDSNIAGNVECHVVNKLGIF